MSIFSGLLKRKADLPEYPSDLRSYLDSYDDKPVFTIVDLGLYEIAPVKDYSRYLAVIIPLQTTGDNPEKPVSDAELRALHDVEAKCIATANKQGWIYTGHAVVTAAEHMYMAFYCMEKDKAQAIETLNHICTKAGRRPTKIVSKDDPEWGFYLERLYPDLYQMQAINHLEIVQDLRNHGDKCTAERPISFWLYFKEKDDAEKCMADAAAAGFEAVSVKDMREEPEQDGSAALPFALHLKRTAKPEIDLLNADAWALIDLAKKYNGEYDGVETEVIK